VFEKIRIIFTIPELRQKILLTLGLLAIYRVGWQVPLPIVDPAAMRAFAEESGGLSDLLKTVAVFFGEPAFSGNNLWPWDNAVHFRFNYFSVIRYSVAPS
jgi:preprotein translocase subunit SecY